jgi:Flp pilus assembly protein TadD
MTRRLFALVILGPLAACQSAGGLSADATARNAPFAADRRGQGVDGLLVGHRLLEAGENELALRAYLRAAGEQGVNADVLSALGSANLRLGRLGQAEQLLRRAVDMDPAFVPAMNNLGVVLMERGKVGEARVVFQQAYALDSGETDSIRENLRLAIAQSENIPPAEDNSVYITQSGPTNAEEFTLVRRDKGQFVLLSQL